MNSESESEEEQVPCRQAPPKRSAAVKGKGKAVGRVKSDDKGYTSEENTSDKQGGKKEKDNTKSAENTKDKQGRKKG